LYCALTLPAGGEDLVRWEQLAVLVWRGKRGDRKGRVWGKKCSEKFFGSIQWLCCSLVSFNFMF